MENNMNLPNIYEFATSELSQDAILAYILAWAKPEYRDSHPEINKLGNDLLRSFVSASAKARGVEDPLANKEVETIEVGTQQDYMDVYGKINGNVFLIVEDKTNTYLHSDQINRYTAKIEADYSTADGSAWRIMPIYVKTGNESTGWQPKGDHGVFYRGDLLKILRKYSDIDNNIVNEFLAYLEKLEQETQGYLTTPIGCWSWAAKQGFYMELEKRLSSHSNTSGDSEAGWHYVANPSGGFLGFYWHWRQLPTFGCKLYLQIEDANRLQIRVSDVTDEEGNSCKARSGLLWSVFRVIQKVAEQERFRHVQVRKSGRFRGGQWAAVADLLFDEGEHFRKADAEGKLDMDGTQERLRTAMDFVDAICKSYK